MSEQEKKSGGSTIEGSVMMVEKSGGRLKQPYRPNELQDSDLHQKRPRASIVPSVAEEFKYITEDPISSENEFKKRNEYEGVPMYDSQKQSVTKKLTSNTKSREHSPESIPLQPIEADKKKGAIAPISQPIPDAEATKDLVAAEKEAAAKVDDDSITEEVEELQTPEVAKKHSEWSDDEEAGGLPRSDSRASRVSRMKASPSSVKKKEISWKNCENIPLKDVETKKSEVCILNRKASVGPCFKNTGPFEGPSGIMICLPKKSLKCVNQPSGISVNISRRCLAKSKSIVNGNGLAKDNSRKAEIDNKSDTVNREVGFVNFLENVKGKVNNVQSKIKSLFRT